MESRKYPELEFFMNELISDVIFAINGQTVPALKQVLALKSPVFKAMFSGNFKESEDKVIEIRDTNAEAFKAMIQWIYCENLVINDENDFPIVVEICRLADKYQLNRLMDAIGGYYKTKISINNFETLSSFAFTYNIKELMDELNVFIDKNFHHFVAKDNEELKRINDKTNNGLFTVLANNYRKTERYFRPLINGTQNPLNINGRTYNYVRDSGTNLFGFDNMSENNY